MATKARPRQSLKNLRLPVSVEATDIAERFYDQTSLISSLTEWKCQGCLFGHWINGPVPQGNSTFMTLSPRDKRLLLKRNNPSGR